MAITPLGTAPQRTDDPQTFATRADVLLGGLPTMVTEINTTISDINTSETNAATSATNAANSAAGAASSASAASASSGVTIWVSGTTYSVGNVRFSPINFQSYRRTTNGAGTTDPSADTTNWAPLVLPSVATFAKTANYTLVAGDKGQHISCTNTITLGFTAAATLGSGWWVYISNAGTGVVTLDPTESINGTGSWPIPPKHCVIVTCTGTAFEIVGFGDKNINKESANIASASSIDLNSMSGDWAVVTGTTTITSITLAYGQRKTLVFSSGGCTLQHSTTLQCPRNNNWVSPTGFNGVVEVLGLFGGGVRVINTNHSEQPYAQFEEQQTSNTASASANGTGGFALFTLNTSVDNTITGCSLSSNQITLPAGKYRFSIVAPRLCSAANGSFQAVMYNVTDSVIAATGTSENQDGSNALNIHSKIEKIINITSTKVFEIQSRSGTTTSVAGPNAAGITEVYTIVQIWKEA